ncbi:hypothetical protein [Pendulispora albinea]|uniref:Uncharacterized protein n=1 Tax=Pendulispora albinea TaxID=2741071 RepID=A0ABZ2LMH1_9BACT
MAKNNAVRFIDEPSAYLNRRKLATTARKWRSRNHGTVRVKENRMRRMGAENHTKLQNVRDLAQLEAGAMGPTAPSTGQTTAARHLQ